MKTPLTNRQKQAMQTKANIFDTALELFNERGFDNVTVEEITQKAGVAKGSFYTYFHSKSEIMLEEFRNIDDYYSKIEEELQGESSAKIRLHQFVSAQLNFIQNEVGLKLLKMLYINVLEKTELEEDLIDTNRYLYKIVSDIIRLGKETGEISHPGSPKTLALYFVRAMRAMFLQWAISNANFDLEIEGMDYYRTLLQPSLFS